jgi:uncharacterized protein (TIGR03437 family)
MVRLALCLLFALSASGQRVITTVAGTDSFFSSDGKPAIQAPLGNNLSGFAFDPDGNLLAADPDNNVVVRIDKNGILTVVAGNGILGYSGDGGPATSASLALPYSVAADSSGNIYISEFVNNVIRKVTPAGIISTVAGGGQNDPGDGGPATQAKIGAGFGIAVANGNVLIAEALQNRIRKIDTSGVITTIAGTGQGGFSGDGGPATAAMLRFPEGISVDGQGAILISDTSNGRVRKITPDGIIKTVAGSDFSFLGPAAAVSDAAGNLYIYRLNQLVQKISSDGAIQSLTKSTADSFGGDGGPSTAASVSATRGLVTNGLLLDNSGNLFVSDADHGRVRKIDGNGIISTTAGNGQFRFAGDGGPAAGALLNVPIGVAVSQRGDIFVSDVQNFRVRAIAPDGGIRTVAGVGLYAVDLIDPHDENRQATAISVLPVGVAADGVGNLYLSDAFRVIRVGADGKVVHIVNENSTQGFSGDGGPATAATLGGTSNSLAIDSAGNLFISDATNHRIRKVTPSGTITTVAGSGPAGFGNGSFSGDGGPATSATLDTPSGVAVDSRGNLYIVDAGNERIRKVTTDGMISTIAGNGTKADGGDGGPATQTPLNLVKGALLAGIVVGADGAVYFSDTARVRRIAPDGTISTFVGNGKFTSFGDGGPPEQASVNPAGLAIDAAGNLYVADILHNRVRVVLAAPPSFGNVPATLTFTGSSGGAATAAQNFTINTTVLGMSFTTSTTTTDGGDWLTVTPASGASPGLIQVIVNPFKLAPGSYTGKITIQVPLANPPTRSVSVALNVQPGVPPALRLDKQNLSFTFPAGASKRSQFLTVYNIGGGSLDFTVGTSTFSGGGWQSVSPSSGSAIPGNPVVLAVTADPAGLDPGTYTGQLTIFGAIVPVAMTISRNNQAILLSQTGLSFTAVNGGGVIPPQSFGVLNIGQGVMNWSVSVSTLSGGNWLSVSQTQGSTDASSDTVPAVDVRVDATGLDAGSYYGLVRVDAPTTANRSQVITILLQVLPSDQDPGSLIQPSELLFTAVAGGTQPGSKDLMVYNIASSIKRYQTVATSDDVPVLYLNLPAGGTLSRDRPTRLVVQPLTTGLAPGVYRGNLSLQFTDGRARDVPLKVIVSPAPSASSATTGLANTPGPCTPTKLIPSLPSLGAAFNVPAGWPVALVADVKDDCGNPMSSGTVRLGFSNGDPQLSMQSLKNGQWHQTWQTGRGAGSQLTISINASSPDQQLQGNRVITGGLGTLQDPPVADRSKIVSAANTVPFVPVAPGSLITIQGDRLAQGQDQGNAPLPEQLAGAQALLGGHVLPLSLAGPNQLNAIVPFDVETNTQLQLLVQRANTYSQPIPIDVADAQPAIFTTPDLTSSQGVIYVVRAGGDPFLATPSSPATAGDTVIVYCAGLGAVNSSIRAGDASPDPGPTATFAIQLNIGGADVAVDSTTLIPGMVGIYQAKASLPSGLPAGDAVPVVVRAAGQTSPAVTIAVR